MRTMAGIVESDAIIDGSVKVDGKEVDELLFAKMATYVQQTVCRWYICTCPSIYTCSADCMFL